jgi:hypothetical protein
VRRHLWRLADPLTPLWLTVALLAVLVGLVAS